MLKKNKYLTHEKIDLIFETFEANNPSPQIELNYTNNFTLTIAVLLSARNTDVAVNKVTDTLFLKYDTPEKMLTLGVEGIKKRISSMGLFNNKAKNIIALCNILIDKYNSTIPDTFENLVLLPGIGRKSANVILSCAFGQTTIAVDTHVFRVSRRLGFSRATTPEKVEQDLMKVIPDKWKKLAHYWLVLHGRYVCKSQKPKCKECMIRKQCVTYNKII